MSETILVLNAGSSSLKFQLFDVARDRPRSLLRGQIEGIARAPVFQAQDAAGTAVAEESWSLCEAPDHAAVLGRLSTWLQGRVRVEDIVAVGHRVVHGGTAFTDAVQVDARVLEQLDQYCTLAPLHQPHNLAAVRAVARTWPSLTQVACFDTAFHRGQPEEAERFALPERFHEDGVRRYGFHGLSYEYIAERLPQIDSALGAARVVVAHLGSGASMCALDAGRSVASTMGFTALDGLVMGTRCGAIDPGVVLHLQRHYGLSVDEVERLLYKESGLAGVSGGRADMRELLGSADPQAARAVNTFVYRIARELGSLVAALGGLDALVFTAGIGERSPPIRARICEAAHWLGVRCAPERNDANAVRIGADDSLVDVLVVPTDEEMMIARHTAATVHARRAA